MNSVKAAVEKPAWLTKTKWLANQRAELVEEQARYTESAAALAAEANELLADRDPGDAQFDEEGGDGDTLAVERDRGLALSGKAADKVAAINDALTRLDAGTYGVCVDGGDIIPKDRLEALPMAAKCVHHQVTTF